MDGLTFEAARDEAARIISHEALLLDFLGTSDRLSPEEKELFSRPKNADMDDKTLRGSLKTLSGLLEKHYGKKVILLIDEYDVPLAKANDRGYYDDMIDLIRAMFNQTLKTNNSLFFTVLTGCLRVSRESIFTGLNNPNILSITKVQFNEYFGFTDALDEADKQTNQGNYVHELLKEGLRTIYKYSVACYKKSCRIRCRKGEFAPEE